MVSLTPAEFLDRLRLVATIAPEPVALVSELPDGPVVDLGGYRADMQKRRLDSVGTPGVWLDTGPTGAGKSTADLAAFETAGRCLSVQTTHENCAAVVKDCLEAGVDAAAYPGRHSSGKKQNCWNTQADAAEAMGLCAVAAVCNHGCEFRRKCLDDGYLSDVAAANAARVAVATHARATHSGLDSLSEGRDYVVLHEDCLNVLCPQVSVAAAALVTAREILNRLLNDPTYLDRFGPAWMLDDDGETLIPNEKGTQKKESQYEFCCHLADTVDRLIGLAEAANDAAELAIGDTMKESPGVQSVLFRICRELDADFGGKPVWSLVFYTATGEFYRQGILIHEHEDADPSEAGTGRQSDLFDAPQPAAFEGDRVAV